MPLPQTNQDAQLSTEIDATSYQPTPTLPVEPQPFTHPAPTLGSYIPEHTNPSLPFNYGQYQPSGLVFSGAFDPDLLRNPWAENGSGVGYDFTQQPNVDITHIPPYVEPEPVEVAPQPVEPEPSPEPELEPEPEPEPIEDVRHCLASGQPYVRRISKGRVIYQHPTAGQTYGKGQTRWEAERVKNNALRGGKEWAMWGSKDEWETVRWLATTKLSQRSANKLLKTERYRGAKYSFKSAKALFKKIRTEMKDFGGPEWKSEDITLSDTDPRDKATLFWRDLQDTADFMFGSPHFAGKMMYAPEIHYNADETARLYENPWTAEDWNKQQNTLPAGTTLGGILIASDATQLSTHSGDVAAHAVYMSLANIDKSVRASTREGGWILIAYIPKSKFQHTMASLEHRPKAVRTKILGMLNRRLFHRCMQVLTRPLRRTEPHDVVDPEGNVRSVLYELSSYIADLEEQWVVAGLGGQTCPHCERDTTHLGDSEPGLPRTPADVVRRIKKIKKDFESRRGRAPSLEESIDLATEHHLNGVNKPFWKFLPNLNIFEVLSPDLLHGFHKMFHDHIYRFNSTGMGAAEYDARTRSQTHFSGDRTFLHGVSHITQMTGMEHRLLEQTHLSVVAHAPGVIDDKVTRATRGILDCIYLARLSSQSDRSLEAYERAYEEFMANRHAWIENGTRRGKKGVIEHFNIPKMHVIRHFTPHVRKKGSADNFTTETMEHLHVGVKEAYRASNRREWKEQTVRYLNQREIVRDFEAWMAWCRLEEQSQGVYSRGDCTRNIDQPDWVGTLDDDSTDDDSSVDTVPVTIGKRKKAEGESESDGESEDEDSETDSTISEVAAESEGDYESPDAYGERLVDVEGDTASERGLEFDKVRRWLMRQTDVVGRKESLKRKRRTTETRNEPNPRCRPRPRLQHTHGLNDLQKLNKDPSIRRKSIQHVCQQYNLDIDRFMYEIDRNPYLADLPIPVDEFTEIDTWHALRTHIQSPSFKSGERMQRIRARPETQHRARKNDPVFYVGSGSNRDYSRAITLD
ncbi:hypothetical protein FRC07_001749, partial [Ceratobasidium sp. 392]